MKKVWQRGIDLHNESLHPIESSKHFNNFLALQPMTNGVCKATTVPIHAKELTFCRSEPKDPLMYNCISWVYEAQSGYMGDVKIHVNFREYFTMLILHRNLITL